MHILAFNAEHVEFCRSFFYSPIFFLFTDEMRQWKRLQMNQRSNFKWDANELIKHDWYERDWLRVTYADFLKSILFLLNWTKASGDFPEWFFLLLFMFTWVFLIWSKKKETLITFLLKIFEIEWKRNWIFLFDFIFFWTD